MPVLRRGSVGGKFALLALAVGLLSALVLSACGSSESVDGGSEGTTSAAGDVHLSLVTASTTQNVFQEITYGGEAAAASQGVTLSTAAPNGVNPPAELSMFQAATQNSKEGIALDTTAPELFIRSDKEASEEGIPVIAADAPAPEGSGVETFVGNSNTALGETVAEQLIKQIPADASGEVVFGTDIAGLTLLEQRIEGMKNVLAAERPNLKLVGPFNVGSEPTENYDNWNNLVKAHPDAVAYMAPGDQDGVSLFRIQKQNGEHYLVGAADVDPIALEAVQKGYVAVLGDPYHFLKGYISVSLLAEHAKSGKEIPKGWWDPGSGIVTKANVAEIQKRESGTKERDEFFEPIAKEELADPSKYLKPISELD